MHNEGEKQDNRYYDLDGIRYRKHFPPHPLSENILPAGEARFSAQHFQS
jgi:hypothetical protein